MPSTELPHPITLVYIRQLASQYVFNQVLHAFPHLRHALYKPVVETAYILFPQSTNKLDPSVHWVSADPMGVAQLWAGILRNNHARLEIIGRGYDCDDLLESMKDLSLTEANIAIEYGTGDVELHWKKGNRSAQFSVKDGPVTRYVWWDVEAVEVVGL